MRRVRALFALAAAVAMIYTSIGSAAAQTTGPWETRADFIYRLDRALGIQPVAPPIPDFQDVSPSNPYYGYVEAAYQKGITNGISPGIFGPTLPITRAEAAKYLVIAYGTGTAAQTITFTSFTDNKAIPIKLVGYVGEAAKLHLMEGFLDGSFRPEQNLTVAQEGYLLSHLQAAIAQSPLVLSASSTDVAPGEFVTLSASRINQTGVSVPAPGVTYLVTGANAGLALVSGDQFVASSPGNYTVEGTDGASMATVTISVYGTTAGLRIVAPATVVANGTSQATVTVEMVDQGGNMVRTATDRITLSANTTAAVGIVGSPGGIPGTSATATAVNGVATFTIQSGQVAGATTTLTASDVTGTGTITSTATVTASLQQATSIVLTAGSPYIEANDAQGQDTISAVVLDQLGNPMLSGAYQITFSVSGAGNFAGDQTSTGVYYGPSQARATAILHDIQGVTGPVTVSAFAQGLTSGVTTVTAVVTGQAVKIAVSPAQTVGASAGANYTVTIEDQNGFPVNWTGTVDLAISDATKGLLNGAIGKTILPFFGQSSRTFTASDPAAGAYTITATDAAGRLTPAVSALTVTPGAVASATITPASSGPPLSAPFANPTWSYTIQLTDAAGNPVAEAGVAVDLHLLPGPSNIGRATLNGISETSGTSGANAVTYTNASGSATANVVAQPYAGDSYSVTATFPTYPTVGTLQGADVTVEPGATVAPIQVTYTNPAGAETSTILADGSPYAGTFTLRDSYGNPSSSGHLVHVTLSGTGTVTLGGGGVILNADGSYTIAAANGGPTSFTVLGGRAGSVTLTLSMEDVAGAPISVSTLFVSPGITAAQIGFFSSGVPVTASAPVTVAAGQIAVVTASPEDAGQNPIVTTTTIAAAVTTVDGTGELRTTPSAPDETTPNVVIMAGQSGSTFYLVNSTSATENVWFTATPVAFTVTPPGDVTDAQANHSDALTFTVSAFGQPLAGVAVTFSTAAVYGGAAGTLQSGTGITNASGQVTAVFTTPSNWQANETDSVTVTTLGFLPQTASVDVTSVTARSITTSASSTANVPAGSTQPITFTVLDAAGQPVGAGTDLTLTATAASGDKGTWGISSSSAQTDASGQVQVILTDTRAGDSGTVTATVTALPGVSSTTAAQTIVAGPAKNIQATPASTSVVPGAGTPVTFLVTDQYGNPVSGATLDVTTTGTLAPLSGITVQSDTSGKATYTYDQNKSDTTLGDSGTVVGTLSTDSTVTGQTATLTLVAGPAKNIKATAGVTSVIPGTGSLVTFTVTDQYGNPVSGATLDVTTTGTLAPLSGVTVQTDTSGKATYTYDKDKSDTTAGDSGTVVGTLSTDSTVTGQTATLTVLAGAPATIQARTNVTSIVPGSGVVVTFTVTDSTGNPVSGATLEVNATGTLASTGSPAPTVTTDAYGRATYTYNSDYTPGDSGTVTGTLSTNSAVTGQTGTLTVSSASDYPSIAVQTDVTDVIPGTGVKVTITVTDSSGKPLSGATLDVTTTLDLTSPSPAVTVTTDSSGIATYTYDSDSNVGDTGTILVSLASNASLFGQSQPLTIVGGGVPNAMNVPNGGKSSAFGPSSSGYQSVEWTGIKVTNQTGGPVLGIEGKSLSGSGVAGNSPYEFILTNITNDTSVTPYPPYEVETSGATTYTLWFIPHGGAQSGGTPHGSATLSIVRISDGAAILSQTITW